MNFAMEFARERGCYKLGLSSNAAREMMPTRSTVRLTLGSTASVSTCGSGSPGGRRRYCAVTARRALRTCGRSVRLNVLAISYQSILSENWMILGSLA